MAQSSSLHAWHVAMVRPNRERHVVAELRKLDPPFEAVWPRIRKREIVGGSRREWRGRERIEIVERPAFPNYIIFTGPTWQRAHDVKELTSVMRRPGNRDAAGTLPAAIVARLLGPDGDGVIEDLSKVIETLHSFVRGQAVTIASGVYADVDGTVISTTYARVRLLVGAVEIDVPAEIVTAA